MRLIRSFAFGCLAMLAAVVLVLASPIIAVLAAAAPLVGLRRYSMHDAASANIQAVGFSLQIGASIWGMAPLSWWTPGRGVDKRSKWPSCLQVRIMPADHNAGTRPAFSVSVGSMRFALRIPSGGHIYRPEELGWSFWHRSMRC